MILDAQKELAAHLGDQLPADWHEAYDANPRHEFLLNRVWYDVHQPVDRHTDPEAWLEYAYRDEAVITQLHDGAERSEHGYPISDLDLGTPRRRPAPTRHPPPARPRRQRPVASLPRRLGIRHRRRDPPGRHPPPLGRRRVRTVA
ncbi:MAG: hypothetical protein WCA46_18480 [Actinocatenispora sp.]